MICLTIAVVLGLGALAGWAPEATAAEVNIVAPGASNTFGMGKGRHAGDGVSPGQAYPAQLQALLKARGVDARVGNAGVPGDTTAGMLARLGSAVPSGTHVVILQPGGNDARRGAGGDRAGNIAAITSRLQARGIKVILLDRIRSLTPVSSRHPDGQHFDAGGHAAVAASLVPRVMAAIK
jgi:acyl-CoA thioesterase-1